MKLELDHIAVAGETLQQATDHVAHSLDVAMQTGGEHAVFHTHNTLSGLGDGLYLEAIAINPDAPDPDRARWFDLDHFSGAARLTNWICRCDDLDAALEVLPQGFGRPVYIERGDLRWRMAVPESGVLPYDNCAPALMEWLGDLRPLHRLRPGDSRLKGLEVRHPKAFDMAAMLAPHLRDPRVTFTEGHPGLSARFKTPSGYRTLS